jgi:serine/threonine protein kinase
MSGAPNLAAGTRVGPYEVLALLGEGGMGQVYRARDERLSREVALKVVHADLAQDAERLRRFEHEAKAAGTLNHPNIVAVYDTGQHDDAPYIVSELLQGETLRDRLATGALGTRKAVECGVQIARGLAAAHEKGIVHRDLKPENLFLTRDGLVKILDFGIAKLGRAGEEKAGTDIETLSHTGTSSGTMLGTVGYMSPEQVRGLPADHRSDLFSFGVVLFEMLTGRRAFKGTTAADTLSAILRKDPTEALGDGPGIPPGLCASCAAASRRAPTTASRPLAIWRSPSKAPRRDWARRPRPCHPRNVAAWWRPSWAARCCWRWPASACGSVGAFRRPGLRQRFRS